MNNELDYVTRYHMNRMRENFRLGISLAFVGGILIGIILASFLHKYIVHPLGW